MIVNNDRASEPMESSSASRFGSAAQPTRIRQRLTVLLVSALALAAIGLIRWSSTADMAGVARQQSKIEALVDEYMVAMAGGNALGAYTLFSPRAQRQMTVTDIEQLTRGDAYLAFQEYQSAHVNSLVVRIVISTNPDSPQGFVAEITGSIGYDDRTEGSFAAVLERSASQWRLFNIRITPPLERLQHKPQAMWQQYRMIPSQRNRTTA